MNPETVEALRIAEKHLAGASVERRKALAHEINEAIMLHAGIIAIDIIRAASAKTRESGH